MRGNVLALVVGERSPRAEAAHRPRVEARVQELIEAKGYQTATAPPDLRVACQHLAWAERWRAEADDRIEAAGGPLTSGGRERRALAVAEKWDKRVEAWARVYSGLRAQEERVDPHQALEAAVAEANR